MKNFDTLLNIGCAFDWITPAWAIIQDWQNGPSAHFGVEAGIWGRGDIRSLLRGYSIKSWGFVYNLAGDMIMFSVYKPQAAYTYYILCQSGVPILYIPESAMERGSNGPIQP